MTGDILEFVNLVPYPVFSIDAATGTVMFWNKHAEELCRCAPEEVAEELTAWSASPEVNDLLVRAKIEESRYCETRAWVSRKDGHHLCLRIHVAKPYSAATGQAELIVFCEDVTPVITLEDQLRQAQKMEAVGNFTAGLAHDLNNLLIAISGFAKLLEPMTGKEISNQHAAAYLKQIMSAADHATSLIDKLLSFGKPSVVEATSVNITQLIAEMGDMLRRLLNKDLDLKISLQPNLPTVRADPINLKQVIMNLIVNAQEAMPTGGTVTMETQYVRPESKDIDLGMKPGHWVRVVVSDTGIGMDEETQTRIFEPFFTTKRRGNGLGLATVYRIVKAHNGHIEVQSKQGIGTRFEIFLPAICTPSD